MPYSREEMLRWRGMGAVWVHYCDTKKLSVEVAGGQICVWCKLTEHEHKIQLTQQESVRTWFKEG